MYRIVTVEREFGCGGGEIAAAIARRLGWKIWDQALTEEIAKVANVEPAAVQRCSERADGTFHRLVKTFWRGSYERSMALHGSEFGPDKFVAIGGQVMANVAKAGNCVIVGRGAPYFLREHGDAFHVFLYAPYIEKMRRLRSLGRSEQEAEEQLNTIDRDRMTFVKRYFDADWPTRCLYHMMINTAIGDEQVIATILSSMERMDKSSAAGPLPSCVTETQVAHK
jgi:cytidylate kinase